MSIHQDLRPYVSYENPTTFENLIRALESECITDIDQLAGLTDADLLEIKGIGEKSIQYIRLAIECKHSELARRKHRLRQYEEARDRALAQIGELQDCLADYNDKITFLEKHIKVLEKQ